MISFFSLHFTLPSHRMNKPLIAIGTLLSLFALSPIALAGNYTRGSAGRSQNYTYDCVCLFSDPNGSCQQYTCDAYQTSSRSNQRNSYNTGYQNGSTYYNSNNCNSYYNGCDTNQPVYRSPYITSGVVSPYYNTSYNGSNNCGISGAYYGSTPCDYQWSDARYTSPGTPMRRYYQQTYDAPMYYY